MKKPHTHILREEPPEDIALSLSGGGHRATLFSLGVLMALVDRGLNKSVKQIASVSGGSITNAFVALHCKYNDESISSEDFDKVADKLIKIVVHKGVLTKPVIAALLSFLLIPPIIFLFLSFVDVLAWSLTAILVAVWCCLALLRGFVVEWLIEARFFPPNIRFKFLPPSIQIQRKHLGDLHDRSVEHVFCCTNLIDPGSVYFTSKRIRNNPTTGGIFGGIEDENTKRWLAWKASAVPIAGIVRASAAFPGIPPRIFRFIAKNKKEVSGYENVFGLEVFDPTPYLKKNLVLADGGIWNNLGTFVLRESDWNYLDYSDMTLITADASVPLAKQCFAQYFLPVWSLLASLKRISTIQHENTVEPRIEPMSTRKLDRLSDMGGKIAKEKLNVICEMLELGEEQASLLNDLNEYGHLNNEEPWDIPVRLNELPTKALDDIVASRRDISAQYGQEYGDVEDAYYRSRDLFTLSEIDLSKMKTHLSRVTKEDAAGLIANGYLNAFSWTMLLKPIEKNEIDLMEQMPHRLNRMTAII